MFFVGPYRTLGTICNDCRFFPYQAGGMGALNLPPAGLGQRSGGYPGGKAPLSSGNLAYKIQPKNSTLWFSFLVQNEFERKYHPFDVPNKANYTFAQI